MGDPEEIAERVVALHKRLGHMRQFFQMDVGHLPQKEFLHAIELLGTKLLRSFICEAGIALERFVRVRQTYGVLRLF